MDSYVFESTFMGRISPLSLNSLSIVNAALPFLWPIKHICCSDFIYHKNILPLPRDDSSFTAVSIMDFCFFVNLIFASPNFLVK